MKRGDPKSAANELRRYALSFPEAMEDFPWGDRVVKVRKKVFVFLGKGDRGLGLSAKLPQSHDAALMLPFSEPTAYGLGRAGWVTAHFDEDQSVPVPLLKEWVRESYGAVAPKKLVQQLLESESEPGPVAARSKRRS
ncbi:MAG TPA: MmcQ/YjbR family DNA-binding protein [Myxococcaceae bacterium]|nr:MmcQ/YjbR family DNA-binding protein [Myxococcaceae bacterium]